MISIYKLTERSYRNPIILFDGDCILCSRFVQWVIKCDNKDIFKFASFQNIVDDPFKLENDYSSVVLIDKGQSFTKSDVIFHIIKNLEGLWIMLLPFKIIPSIFRNAIYDFIAQNRYTWFGKKTNCLIMTPEIKSKFNLL